jgi:hypothetical protein
MTTELLLQTGPCRLHGGPSRSGDQLVRLRTTQIPAEIGLAEITVKIHRGHAPDTGANFLNYCAPVPPWPVVEPAP